MGILRGIGFAGKIGLGMGKGVFGLGRGLARTAKNVLSGGPKAWGLGAMLPGQYRALQFAIPAVGLGALGIQQAMKGLSNAPYDMEGPRVGRLGQSNNLMPEAPNMEFGTFRRSYLDMNASGSLAFALHNRR